MKLIIASDIHGSAYWCRRLLDAFTEENADRLVLLGDLLYHGPRNDFPDEYEILAYLKKCYAFAIKTIGYKQTDTNVICAIIVTESNRRNLFVYYLPLTNSWQRKVCGNEFSTLGNRLQLRNEDNEPIYRKVTSNVRPLLCHSEFWKQRGALLSYSDLQEKFYNEISYRYGAERGESKSRLKYTSNEQIKRFNRKEGDEYDIMPEIKGVWI